MLNQTPLSQSAPRQASAAAGAEPEQRSAPPEFAEKRNFPRFPFRGRAKAIVLPSPASPPGTELHDSEVITSDLSRGGVSILYRHRLNPGQQLLLMLNDKTQLVEVRWCCRVWEELFAAGCQFLKDSTPIDVDQQLNAIDVVISSEDFWHDPSAKV
jgi:hypothetical protein